MYKHKDQPLLPRKCFIARMFKHLGAAALLIFISLGIGVLDYRVFVGLSWVDALYNASLILVGEGPSATLSTDLSKVFVSLYALYSGVIFVAAAGIIVTPIAHRLIHHFHTEEKKEAEKRALEHAEEGNKE